MTCFKVLPRGRDSFALLVVWAVLSTSAMGGGSLLWYDGFSIDEGGDYTLTSDEIVIDDTVDPPVETRVIHNPLGGQSGGLGTFMTGGPWIQGGGDDAWVLPDSLERTSQDGSPAQIVPSIGGSIGDDPASRAGCCLTQRNGMDMATPWGGFTDPDGTFYMSFLANFGAGPTLHHRVIEWWDGPVDDANKTLEFGISEFSGIGGGQQLALKVRDAVSGTFTEAADLGPGTQWREIQDITQSVLLKFDMSTAEAEQDTISLYLNPVGDEGSNTPNAQISVDQFLMTTLGSFSAFVFGPATEPSFDELRVGTTWDAVQNNLAAHYWTPIPFGIVGGDVVVSDPILTGELFTQDLAIEGEGVEEGGDVLWSVLSSTKNGEPADPTNAPFFVPNPGHETVFNWLPELADLTGGADAAWQFVIQASQNPEAMITLDVTLRVPEPATTSLLGLALVGLVGLRRWGRN
jgi:hypothetical protein